MKYSRNLIIILLCVLSEISGCTKTVKMNQFEKGGYTSLFNGEDLSGWKIPEGDNGHWKVVDGVIDYDSQSEAEGDKHLWTEKEFGDFKLHIEWRFKGYSGLYSMPIILPNGEYKTDIDGNVIREMKPNSDSGILLKNSGQLNLWCWDVGSGEMWKIRTNDNLPHKIRRTAIPKVKADNPVGEWNIFDITVIGETVSTVLNGKTVIDKAPYPGMNETGSIGLQHHGGIDVKTGKLKGASSLIQVRNIWIKEYK